jgi:hypothetical protein
VFSNAIAGAVVNASNHLFLLEAIEVFNADLKTYPNNLWALTGLVGALSLQLEHAQAEAKRLRIGLAGLAAAAGVGLSEATPYARNHVESEEEAVKAEAAVARLESELAAVQALKDKAAVRADFPVVASCFCAMAAGAAPPSTTTAAGAAPPSTTSISTTAAAAATAAGEGCGCP